MNWSSIRFLIRSWEARFYERREIKDICLSQNGRQPFDSLNLKGSSMFSPRGSEKTIEKLRPFPEKGLFRRDETALEENWLSGLPDQIEEFIHLGEEFEEDANILSPALLTKEILTKTGYLDRLRRRGRMKPCRGWRISKNWSMGCGNLKKEVKRFLWSPFWIRFH
jgi:hypothetical protein